MEVIVMAPLDDFFFGFALGFVQILGKTPTKELGLVGFFMVFCHFLLGPFQGWVSSNKKWEKKILGKKTTQVTATACAPAQRSPDNRVKPGDVSVGCTTKDREV